MSSLTPPITPENALEVLADWARPGSYASVDGDWVHRLCAEVQKKVEDLQSKPSQSWSHDWPTEPGWYWFYGREFRLSAKDEFHAVEVHATATPDAMAYVTRGHFLYPEEGATGLWLPLETPTLPEEVPA